MNRKQVLEAAEKLVDGDRQTDYGTPKQNFQRIADLWNAYLSERPAGTLKDIDVAAMMILLKVARVAGSNSKDDNWIDIAGYAACGGEIQSAERPLVSQEDSK